MWQTDTVTFQIGAETNDKGYKTISWSDNGTVVCDVQDITKEIVLKKYGYSEQTDYKQVFDHTNSDKWVVGNQVKFDDIQYLVRKVDNNMAKMGASNHIYVILSRVV